jgi:hypothetical protein
VSGVPKRAEVEIAADADYLRLLTDAHVESACSEQPSTRDRFMSWQRAMDSLAAGDGLMVRGGIDDGSWGRAGAFCAELLRPSGTAYWSPSSYWPSDERDEMRERLLVADWGETLVRARVRAAARVLENECARTPSLLRETARRG